MKNKVLSLVFALVVIVGIVPVYADDVDNISLENSRNVLLNSGWTEEEIDDLLNEEALKDFNKAVLVSSDEKYFKITKDDTRSDSSLTVIPMSKEECLKEVEEIKNNAENREYENVITEDGYLKYYVQSYKVADNEYVLSSRYEWLIAPYKRQIDVFGLGHGSQLRLKSGKSYDPKKAGYKDVFYVYKTNIKDDWKKPYEYVTHKATGIKRDDGGVVIKQRLKSDHISNFHTRICSKHRGYLQYHTVVNNVNDTGCAVYAEYLHQSSYWTVSPSISYDGPSVSVSYKEKFESLSPNPYIDIKF